MTMATRMTSDKSGISLREFMSGGNELTMRQSIHVVGEVVRLAAVLHENGRIQADVGLDTVFVDDNLRVQLTPAHRRRCLRVHTAITIGFCRKLTIAGFPFPATSLRIVRCGEGRVSVAIPVESMFSDRSTLYAVTDEGIGCQSSPHASREATPPKNDGNYG